MNHRAADTALEAELRAAFAEVIQDLPPTRDPWARTTRALARSRARRRAGALATVVVAAAVGVLAVVQPAPRPDPPPAGPVVTDPDIRSWPTRGDLAGQADLRAEVVARVQAPGGPRVVSVPFLGTVGDLTAALVVGVPPADSAEREDRLQIVLLYGRPSVPVDRWTTQSSMTGENDHRVLAATFTDSGERTYGIAVTLSEGVRLAWSPHPFVDPGGRPVRRYVPLALDGGVGTWSSRWRAGLTTVRVEGAFVRTVTRPTIEVVTEDDPTSGPVVERAPSCPGRTYQALVDSGLSNAYREAGVRPAEVTRVRAMWCGRVGQEDAVLVGVTTKDGTDFQVLNERTRLRDGTGYQESSTVRLVPPGRGLDYPLAVELSVDEELTETTPDRTVVTILAPGNVTAELHEGNPPAVLAQRKLTGAGFARVELRGFDSYRWRDTSASPVLVTRDVRGTVLHRVPVDVDAPWGTELDGPDAPSDAAPSR